MHQDGTETRHAVEVVGAPDAATTVAGMVERAGLEVVRPKDVSPEHPAAARIFVPPPQLTADEIEAEMLRRARDSAPMITVTMSDEITQRDLLRLQARGDCLVVRWPQARDAVMRLLVELVSEGNVVELPSQEDAELTHEIRQALVEPGLDVIVANRAAVLLGTVRSLWELSSARRRVGAFPGVRAVSTDAVVIDAPHVDDGEIEHVVRGVMRADSGIEDTTVVAAVHNGCVTLSGVVADRREHDGLLCRIERVRGVVAINDLLTMSVTGKRRSQEAGRPVREHVRTRFPQQDIEVTLFDDVVVLEGAVDDEQTRRVVAHEIEDALDGRLLVNKLDVIDPQR